MFWDQIVFIVPQKYAKRQFTRVVYTLDQQVLLPRSLAWEEECAMSPDTCSYLTLDYGRGEA